jgi:hypothetical protein
MQYFSLVARRNNSESVYYALLHVTNSSLQSILERTGYSLDVTTGQRKYGGPPPGWDGPTPGNGCEVSCAFIVYSCRYLLNVTIVTWHFHSSVLNIAAQ